VAIASSQVSAPRMGALTDTPSTIATTDASGAWTAVGIAPGGYRVTASAPGFVASTTDKIVVAAGEHKDHVDVALDAGGTIVSGTITDVGGGAIAGARITARNNAARLGRSGDEIVAISGDDGAYKLSLADGNWFATVTHEDYTHASKFFRVAGTPLVVDF